MDKAKMLRLCNDIECIVSVLIDKIREIAAEITAPPKSNADRIRQMTDEELAEFILESRPICKLCKKHDEICEGAYHECWNGIDDWLKQEVSKDADK